MLTQKDKKDLKSKFKNIYKSNTTIKDIDYFINKIISLINNFNKKNFKKKRIYLKKLP